MPTFASIPWFLFLCTCAILGVIGRQPTNTTALTTTIKNTTLPQAHPVNATLQSAVHPEHNPTIYIVSLTSRRTTTPPKLQTVKKASPPPRLYKRSPRPNRKARRKFNLVRRQLRRKAKSMHRQRPTPAARTPVVTRGQKTTPASQTPTAKQFISNFGASLLDGILLRRRGNQYKDLLDSQIKYFDATDPKYASILRMVPPTLIDNIHAVTQAGRPPSGRPIQDVLRKNGFGAKPEVPQRTSVRPPLRNRSPGPVRKVASGLISAFTPGITTSGRTRSFIQSDDADVARQSTIGFARNRQTSPAVNWLSTRPRPITKVAKGLISALNPPSLSSFLDGPGSFVQNDNPLAFDTMIMPLLESLVKKHQTQQNADRRLTVVKNKHSEIARDMNEKFTNGQSILAHRPVSEGIISSGLLSSFVRGNIDTPCSGVKQASSRNIADALDMFGAAETSSQIPNLNHDLPITILGPLVKSRELKDSGSAVPKSKSGGIVQPFTIDSAAAVRTDNNAMTKVLEAMFDDFSPGQTTNDKTKYIANSFGGKATSMQYGTIKNHLTSDSMRPLIARNLASTMAEMSSVPELNVVRRKRPPSGNYGTPNGFGLSETAGNYGLQPESIMRGAANKNSARSSFVIDDASSSRSKQQVLKVIDNTKFTEEGDLSDISVSALSFPSRRRLAWPKLSGSAEERQLKVRTRNGLKKWLRQRGVGRNARKVFLNKFNLLKPVRRRDRVLYRNTSRRWARLQRLKEKAVADLQFMTLPPNALEGSPLSELLRLQQSSEKSQSLIHMGPSGSVGVQNSGVKTPPHGGDFQGRTDPKVKRLPEWLREKTYPGETRQKEPSVVKVIRPLFPHPSDALLQSGRRSTPKVIGQAGAFSSDTKLRVFKQSEPGPKSEPRTLEWFPGLLDPVEVVDYVNSSQQLGARREPLNRRLAGRTSRPLSKPPSVITSHLLELAPKSVSRGPHSFTLRTRRNKYLGQTKSITQASDSESDDEDYGKREDDSIEESYEDDYRRGNADITDFFEYFDKPNPRQGPHGNDRKRLSAAGSSKVFRQGMSNIDRFRSQEDPNDEGKSPRRGKIITLNKSRRKLDVVTGSSSPSIGASFIDNLLALANKTSDSKGSNSYTNRYNGYMINHPNHKRKNEPKDPQRTINDLLFLQNIAEITGRNQGTLDTSKGDAEFNLEPKAGTGPDEALKRQKEREAKRSKNLYNFRTRSRLLSEWKKRNNPAVPSSAKSNYSVKHVKTSGNYGSQNLNNNYGISRKYTQIGSNYHNNHLITSAPGNYGGPRGATGNYGTNHNVLYSHYSNYYRGYDPVALNNGLIGPRTHDVIARMVPPHV